MTTILSIRKRILSQAVRGELAPQSDSDNDASLLYRNIQHEKERMIKEGLIKKEKPYAPIESDEIPFELPEKWVWVRLGEISNFIDYRGKTPKKTESGIPLITAKNVKKDYISIAPQEFINEDDYASWMTRGIPNKGDILFTTEAPLGNVAQIELNEKFALAQRIIAIQFFNGIINRFMKYVLLSPPIQQLIHDKATGTTALGIKASKLKEVLIPLPPTNEQVTIANKIEELFSLCSQLENEAKFQQNQINILWETVLKDALHGSLVSQNEKDEPVSKLLERIQILKEQLIKEKKIQKTKPLSPIEQNEIKFELPSGWKWVRLGELSKIIHYGYTASATEKDTGVRMVRITDIQNEKVNWNSVPFCEIENNSIEKYQLCQDDILIARTGGTVGKSFLVDTAKYVSVFASYLIRIQLYEEVNALYVKRFLESKIYWDQIRIQAKGTGQPNVNATGLSNLLLPLPPIEEQQRIVEKVQAVWELINDIESNTIEVK